MEDLNKQQLILLVLLISFVTSIGTGIITVSLLNEAPVEVQQTINRVVERTVETVVPENIQPEERVVTVRETVVVSEEDRVVGAIEKNSASLVRIARSGNPETPLAMGIIASADGLIVTDDLGFRENETFEVILENGTSTPAVRERLDSETGLLYLRVTPTEGQTLSPAVLGQSALKLGQSVVAISGQNRNVALTGHVTDLLETGEGIVTDVGNQSELFPGSVLLNLSGEVVGLKLSESVPYLPVSKIKLTAE